MNATDWQIKSLYCILARLYHPDRQPINLSKDDSNRTFAFINNAYEILGNTEKRRVHDVSLRIGEADNGDAEGYDDEDKENDKDNDNDDDSNGDGVRPPEEASTSCACN
jgi:DnaJ-class molecular chaperone